MMNHPMHESHVKPVYQADPSHVPTLLEIKRKAREIVLQFLNRHVRIQLLDGRSFEGMIVNVDEHYVYIQLPLDHSQTRAFYPPYNPYYSNAILPLVLYELLVISLLS